MKKLLPAFLFVFTFSHCNHKVYSLQNLPDKYIEIGSYGGFTGMQKSYFLLPNGQRFMKNGMPGDTSTANAVELTKTSAKEFSQLAKELKDLKLEKISLKSSGNMNYFIRFKQKKEETTAVWDNMESAPKNLVTFYKHTIKNLNNQTIN